MGRPTCNAISHQKTPCNVIKIETPSEKWQSFCDQIISFLEADLLTLQIDGRPVTGFRSPDSKALWIRDHSDMLRGGKYLLEDVKSTVQCFVDAQAANGRIYDFVTTYPLYATGGQENWETWVRVPIEADVEYRLVKASYLAWQASSDDEWMLQLLPALERAVLYSMRSPLRWDKNHELIKRPYTIDTWDFDLARSSALGLNFQIDEFTQWGIMHGDNSGFFEALMLLGTLFKVSGQFRKAARCRNLAYSMQERANSLLFNGSYYTHFYKLDTAALNGFDESKQLSLSNPMAINRGMATPEMATAILEEYQKRRQSSNAFAEWFSIDPPFPPDFFGDTVVKAGTYCNGGIMPLVGGELAKASFSYGKETYGLSILEQYREMIMAEAASYLWYYPDGSVPTIDDGTSPDFIPTDGWGSSAMLYALVEGLCGIEDLDNGFGKVRCSPRWLKAGENEAVVEVSYPASNTSFGYRYTHDPEGHVVHLSVQANSAEVIARVLLPEGASSTAVFWDGREVTGTFDDVGESRYVHIEGDVQGTAEVDVYYGL